MAPAHSNKKKGAHLDREKVIGNDEIVDVKSRISSEATARKPVAKDLKQQKHGAIREASREASREAARKSPRKAARKKAARKKVAKKKDANPAEKIVVRVKSALRPKVQSLWQPRQQKNAGPRLRP